MKKRCVFHRTKGCKINRPVKLITEKLKMFYFGQRKIGFAVCKSCGLVFQSPSPSHKEIIKYYIKISNYFDNYYKPTPDKIKSVNRHINIVKDEINKFPEKVLEVSLLNLYNLNQFKKNGSKTIEGLEPSKIIAKNIRRKHKIVVHNSTIEEFNFKKKYDLIIMSHVLEHLFDPLKALKKCSKSQNVGQHILVEVPLFQNIENVVNGSLYLEHLYYFSENNFLELISNAGYKAIYVSKIIESTSIPFITVIAKKIKKQELFVSNDTKEQIINLIKYKNKNIKIWKNLQKKINKFEKKKPIYLYGAGYHTSQLLFYTNIEKKFKILGILDSAKVKHFGKLGNYSILPPKINMLNQKSNIIICSLFSEEIIFNSLKHFRKKGIKTYKLYGKN